MTIEQLLDIPPQQILDMPEAELQALLAPLIPQARAPYAGPKAETYVIKSTGQVKSRKHLDRQLAQLNAILGIDKTLQEKLGNDLPKQ